MTVARLVRDDERAAAGRTLASAFADDPVFHWLLSDAAKRPLLTDFWMQGAVESAHAAGSCWVTSDLGAVAVWGAPGRPGIDGRIMGRLSAMLLGAEGARTAEVGAVFEELGSHKPDEPHWYLSLLGAETKGVGSGAAVIAPVLEICDATGEAAHLESSNPRNIGFYERFGFETVAEVHPDDGPLISAMTRPPS